ncbi:type II secretion system F family protein [Clostridium cibarium]|uniref:Type II secretion system F family protein n=1 Tax=Clostridium cibarium TaxID=2762247 RepID=A0ABR8PU85_9CLOT|nr:type II secretion system F family protein [Clostridium cibarium]
MKRFKYKAMKSDGSKVEGEYESYSKDLVLSMITSNGYYPLRIEEIVESKKIEFKFRKKVKLKDLSVFCRQLYTMLDAGISITNALNILRNQLYNYSLKDAISQIEADVKKGEMLSDAMKKHGDIFPNLVTSMVESGEVSGNLDEMMLRLSVNYEKENRINKKVVSAMIYPIILSIVAVLAVMIIMIFVMPIFIQIFNDMDVKLPIVTKALLAVSGFLQRDIIFILLIIMALIGGFIYYKQTEKGMWFVSKAKLKMPIIGKLSKKIIVSRFTRTLSTLMASGVSLIQALPIVGAVLGNKVAGEAIATIRERVARGEGLSDPIKRIEIFPPMLSSMIKIGEEAGSLDDILNKTADFYDEEVEEAIQNVTALIEPLLIIVMGVVIGFIVAAIMLPIVDMYSAM